MDGRTDGRGASAPPPPFSLAEALSTHGSALQPSELTSAQTQGPSQVGHVNSLTSPPRLGKTTRVPVPSPAPPTAWAAAELNQETVRANPLRSPAAERSRRGQSCALRPAVLRRVVQQTREKYARSRVWASQSRKAWGGGLIPGPHTKREAPTGDDRPPRSSSAGGGWAQPLPTGRWRGHVNGRHPEPETFCPSFQPNECLGGPWGARTPGLCLTPAVSKGRLCSQTPREDRAR